GRGVGHVATGVGAPAPLGARCPGPRRTPRPAGRRELTAQVFLAARWRRFSFACSRRRSFTRSCRRLRRRRSSRCRSVAMGGRSTPGARRAGSRGSRVRRRLRFEAPALRFAHRGEVAWTNPVDGRSRAVVRTYSGGADGTSGGEPMTVFRRWGGFVVDHPRTLIAAVLAVTALLGVGVTWLHFSIREGDALPQGHPYVQVYNRINEQFGGGAAAVIGILPHSGDVFTPDTLGKVARLTAALEAMPELARGAVWSVAARRVK